MASEAGSALVKSPQPAASPPLADSKTAGVASTPATATAAAVPKASANSKGSGASILSSTLQGARPRRGSSDDYGISDLGSVGGSVVGFGNSVEFSVSGIGLGGIGAGSNSSTHHPVKEGGSQASSTGNHQNNTSILSNLKGVRTSPSGRRPFRKRKASVDFSFPVLSIDDSDSSYSVSQLLPQHHGLSTAKAPAATVGARSSTLTLPSPANRSRLYSDLTIPESLMAGTKTNPGSAKSDKSKPSKPKSEDTTTSRDLPKDQILPSVDALPAMEDDSLPPIDNDAHSLLLPHPESPVSNANHTHSTGSSSNPAILRKDRAYSFASIRTEGHGVDRLDSLGVEATISASRIRKGSSVTSDKSQKSQDSANNSYDGTLGSQSHRFLMEAFLGDGTESLVLNPSQRERLGSFDAAAEVHGANHNANSSNNSNQNNSHSQNNNNSHQIVIPRERLNSIGGRRNRLESWGGMSDLSLGMKDLKADQNLSEPLGTGMFNTGSQSNHSGSGTAAAPTDKTAALAATIYTSLANDVTGAANMDGNESVSSFLIHDEKIPSRISVNHARDRLNSIASMGTDASALVRLSGLNDFNDADFPSDVHHLIQATMTSVEDQLADLATAVEAVSKDTKGDQDSEISSTASPMIGAASDFGSNRSTDSNTGRPRSSSVSSMLQISVDYDAVAAAVHAAEAAAGALDLSSFSMPLATDAPTSASHGIQRSSRKRTLPTQKKPPRSTKKGGIAGKKASSKTPKKKRGSATESLPPSKRACLPTNKKARTPVSKSLTSLELTTPVIPKTKMDDREMEKLRERARAAAGYVPPSANSALKAATLPPKKRNAIAPATPANAPRPSTVGSGSNFKTPTISNKASSKYGATPASAYSSGTPASTTKGQSSQKWESMFDCLLKFIEQRKEDGTAGMTEEQKAQWAWDGNVPTTYKTKDGKALGRWVNNQRSAKSKGSLKIEREKRLVDAGLKWSVLASNSWNEMLEELRLYVAEQVKQGKKWDGNVPTNYRIKVTRDKAKSFLKDDDEDKNLGRWVNRQRSMFQAGKLRKDRQLALEKIGLKWSMLATTSWESMFETLCQYIKEKQKGGNEWDGNVPANYRTEDVPPRALGRWINRQRSAYGKSKLKPEYVAKLNEIGLKWSIHERRPTYHQYRPDATKSSTKSANTSTPASKAPAAPSKNPSSTTKVNGGGAPALQKPNTTIPTKPDTVGSTSTAVVKGKTITPSTSLASEGGSTKNAINTTTTSSITTQGSVASNTSAAVAQTTKPVVPTSSTSSTTPVRTEKTASPPVTAPSAPQQTKPEVTNSSSNTTIKSKDRPVSESVASKPSKGSVETSTSSLPDMTSSESPKTTESANSGTAASESK